MVHGERGPQPPRTDRASARCTSIYMGHMRYIWLKKFGRSRAPRTRRCENACQRAQRCPLMAATAVWALWTTAEHVSSMARPTTDDNITVYDDAVFCDSETQ